MSSIDRDKRFEQARHYVQGGHLLEAESVYHSILEQSPGHVRASSALAQLALLQGNAPRAIQALHDLVQVHPNDADLALDYAAVLADAGQLADSIAFVESLVTAHVSHYPAWLFLGHAKDAAGDRIGALRAWYKAVIGAQRLGHWKDPETTPTGILEPVVEAIEQVRVGRRELLFDAYDDLRKQYGAAELRRVDRALTGYLREWNSAPTDTRQRPKFFYFPDLPNTAYHDPALQPWAERLRASYEIIRDEAMRVWQEDQSFEGFLELSDKGRLKDYVGGDGVAPSWEAFFFYRHGERFDENHVRCPRTSELLESIDLCRIADQAPEICFSVLKPGTHILPHYGVSNVRLVMHLPLLVPSDCALNLIGVGEHQWQEGRLVMFDDTFQHEAWNRSESTRIVLLMDCWNPHLTRVERVAVKQLIEIISGYQMADRAAKRSGVRG